MSQATLSLKQSNSELARSLELALELDSLNAEHQVQVSTLQEENAGLSNQLAGAIRNVADLREELERAKADQAESKIEGKQASQELRELNNRCQNLEAEIGGEKEKRRALQSANKEMKAKLQKYDGPKLKAQLVKTKDKVKQLTDDVKRQSTAYSSLKKIRRFTNKQSRS